jgi:hypothetical protein
MGLASIRLRPTYNFLCLFYAKYPRWLQNTPGRLSHKIKRFPPKTNFRGFVAPPPHTKTSSKIGKANLFPHAIQKPIFSAASTAFEGGCDGRGFGGFTFLAMQGQPSHRSILALNGHNFGIKTNLAVS